MKNHKLYEYKIKILLNELETLELNEIYVEEFTNTYKTQFMSEVVGLSDESITNSGDTKNGETQIKKEDIYDVDEDDKQRIKEIYRTIAKQTHPDKINDNYLNQIYIESHKAYEKNDLLSLYKLCKKLNIEIEFVESDITLLQKIVNLKKQKSTVLETSFLWLWVHAKTKEEKESVIYLYIKQSKGI